ncbi:hypothetical protein BV25DRAFT_1830726 [Artomyces pyxidatus]|uniref:Uncharacterized protein n=1 Tax=Artomyces pyxidatus TaxID=48021 RepID=A0ACB8SPW4_9AGAM|nr:hypothetical protein BV25DRAFT_1830726 [Artomyces pyxidatus]
MEYFNRPRQHSRPPQPDIGRADVSPILTTHSLDDRSIYIFPSPPSAPPSPAGVSAHSTPTHLSIRGIARPRDDSVGSSALRSSEHGWDELTSPLGMLSDTSGAHELDADIWEWPSEDGADEREADVLEEEITRASRWDLVAPRHGRPLPRDVPVALRRSPVFVRERTHSGATSGAGPVPHPRIHLPLLSLFASLLSIDESTLHLISHSPSHSILFAGHPSSFSEDALAVGGEAERPHGVYALLTPAGEQAALKEGLRVVCDPSIVPSVSSSFPLLGLFDLVKGVWTGGGRAWRDIWR